MNRHCPPALLGVIVILFGPCCLAHECEFVSAQERWPIKTSIPAKAVLADATIVDVQSLIDLPNPQLTKTQRRALQQNSLPGAVQLSSRWAQNHWMR